MAIRIKTRTGESVQQMMRRFKKLCEKEGLTKEVKKRHKTSLDRYVFKLYFGKKVTVLQQSKTLQSTTF